MALLLKKWGHSAAVRIPAHILEAAHLSIEQPVEAGRIIIAPVPPSVTLEQLVAGITPHNRHADSDFGAPVGREIW